MENENDIQSQSGLYMTTEQDNNELIGLLHNSGLYTKDELYKLYDKFNMFGFFNTHYRIGPTREYVFFTKPDLCIFNSTHMSLSTLNAGTKTKEFYFATESHPNVLRQLQLGLNQNEPLSALLYNMRSSSLEIPDLESSEMETGTNMWGQKTFYRRASTASDTDHNFSLEFNDTKFLDVFTFFKLYDLYEERKAYGMIDLYTNSRYRNYIFTKRLHDQMAIFKFVVGEDGSELIYWVKYYGVYPKNVPRSALGDIPEDGNIKFTINFKANFIEDCNPVILEDFNQLSLKHYGNTGTKSLYVPEGGYVRNEFAYPPLIKKDVVDGRVRYFLMWRD